jgi:hypothetical protein
LSHPIDRSRKRFWPLHGGDDDPLAQEPHLFLPRRGPTVRFHVRLSPTRLPFLSFAFFHPSVHFQVELTPTLILHSTLLFARSVSSLSSSRPPNTTVKSPLPFSTLSLTGSLPSSPPRLMLPSWRTSCTILPSPQSPVSLALPSRSSPRCRLISSLFACLVWSSLQQIHLRQHPRHWRRELCASTPRGAREGR